jgi:mono/diheme cytochrome c family protein
MKMTLKISLLSMGLTSCAVSGATLQATELGDVDAGKQYAEQYCAGCHDVATPNPMEIGSGIPTFAAVANKPRVTRTSLVVWMQSSHPKMPNLMLEPQDLDNVIAYILSLKRN